MTTPQSLLSLGSVGCEGTPQQFPATVASDAASEDFLQEALEEPLSRLREDIEKAVPLTQLAPIVHLSLGWLTRP